MSPLWLLFASLTVVGSLTYNVSMKLGTARTSVFAFALIMSAVLTLIQITNFLIAKYWFKVDVMSGLNSQGVLLAVSAACGVALIDIFYFLALRLGSPIQCQTFWTIGGMIALTIFSVVFFKEAVTLPKTCGVVLGIVALFLITW